MALQNSNGIRRGATPFGSPHTPGGHERTPRPLRPEPPDPAPRTAPPAAGTAPAERELGISLYRLRLENGLSLRALAQRLGYNAHSVVSDIEKGRKIPSESLIQAYEKCFGLPDGSLLVLRRRALAQRAERLAAKFASGAGVPDPPPPAGVRDRDGLAAAPPPAPGSPTEEESVADVFGRLVVAVLNESRRMVDRWRR